MLVFPTAAIQQGIFSLFPSPATTFTKPPTIISNIPQAALQDFEHAEHEAVSGPLDESES
jgi:hypothetical protein